MQNFTLTFCIGGADLKRSSSPFDVVVQSLSETAKPLYG